MVWISLLHNPFSLKFKQQPPSHNKDPIHCYFENVYLSKVKNRILAELFEDLAAACLEVYHGFLFLKWTRLFIGNSQRAHWPHSDCAFLSGRFFGHWPAVKGQTASQFWWDNVKPFASSPVDEIEFLVLEGQVLHNEMSGWDVYHAHCSDTVVLFHPFPSALSHTCEQIRSWIIFSRLKNSPISHSDWITFPKKSALPHNVTLKLMPDKCG